MISALPSVDLPFSYFLILPPANPALSFVWLRFTVFTTLVHGFSSLNFFVPRLVRVFFFVSGFVRRVVALTISANPIEDLTR